MQMAPFVHRLRVRYNECDQQNAVFNSNYLVYCDVAITELWREAFGSYDDMPTRFGIDLVVAETNIRYLSPARFDDELELKLQIERFGDTSITTRFDIERGGELLAQARIRHVFITIADGKKAPMPDEVRDRLRRYESE